METKEIFSGLRELLRAERQKQMAVIERQEHEAGDDISRLTNARERSEAELTFNVLEGGLFVVERIVTDIGRIALSAERLADNADSRPR